MGERIASYRFTGQRIVKTEGSAFGIANALRKLRGVRGSAGLAQRARKPLQSLFSEIREGEYVEPDTELPNQIMDFLKGSQSGTLDLAFDVEITDTEMTGNVSGQFDASNLNIDVSADFNSEEEVRAIVRDMLSLLLQYNILIGDINIDILRRDNGSISIEAVGGVDIPKEVEYDQRNLRALSNTRFFRDFL